MVNQADRPLVKVTLNLFLDDYNYYRERYPQNFTTAIRNAINQSVQQRRHMEDNNE